VIPYLKELDVWPWNCDPHVMSLLTNSTMLFAPRLFSSSTIQAVAVGKPPFYSGNGLLDIAAQVDAGVINAFDPKEGSRKCERI